MDACREYCRSIRVLTEAMDRMRNKEESFKPLWDRDRNHDDHRDRDLDLNRPSRGVCRVITSSLPQRPPRPAEQGPAGRQRPAAVLPLVFQIRRCGDAPVVLLDLVSVHRIHRLQREIVEQRQAVADDLKAVYRAPTAEAAEVELNHFADKWGTTHGSIDSLWRRNWQRVIPFFEFAPEIRKIIYTTNAVESLNFSLRKVTKTRAAFPSEQAALKLLYLALRNVAAKWVTTQGWSAALNQFTLLWEDRIRAATARP